MRLTYWKRDDGACGYYRVELPLSTLTKHNKDVQTTRIMQGDTADRILKSFESDIFIIPRMNEVVLLDTMKELQRQGKKVVIDHDDDVFNISPLSPHYEEHGTENVKITLKDGSILPLWEDGKNIDLKKNRERMETTKKAVEVADLITVTTDILADVYRRYNSNVAVLPNCIDTNIWKPLPLKETNEIRLFWAGGHSHYEDWCLLTDVLPTIIKKYANVKLVLMGAKFDATLRSIPQDRIEFHPWIHTMAYPYKVEILNPIIGIIPLQDTEFNRAKSPIKWVEMTSLGVPCVTSYVSPYKEIATENNGIFIEENDTEGWIKGISMLIEDREWRNKIGSKAQETVNALFDINKRYVDWYDTYSALIEGKYGRANCN